MTWADLADDGPLPPFRRAILPEDYDFLSNRQSTFEEQENMTVVPNYDAPTPEQLAVEDAAWDAITEKHKDTLGIISRLVLENAELRSRLSSVEQRLNGALYALHDLIRPDNGYCNQCKGHWRYRTDGTYWYEDGEHHADCIGIRVFAAARSSSDQEGR